MNGLRKYRSQLALNSEGTVFVKFALTAPVLLTIGLSTIDFAWTFSHKSVLQQAADTAAIAGAKELSLADAERESVEAAVRAMVKRYVTANSANLFKKKAAALNVKTNIINEPLSVEVLIEQKVEPLVGGAFGIEFPPLKIHSVAQIVGRPNICALALETSDPGAISLEHYAKVTGRNCAVYSNSTHTIGLKSKNSATLSASFICTRGGTEGGPGNFSPPPMTDCPGFEDPLAGRTEPTVGACLYTDLVVNNEVRTLRPGTYCGGITVTNLASVELQPGVYVFKDGPFTVTGGGQIKGDGVGLFFTGKDAFLNFDYNSSIRLKAPSTGDMAGLLVFESRSQSKSTQHYLHSNDAPVLLGTIYVPRGELRIDADEPIAQDSAYTAIVARTMRLYGGPHLILNTNYDSAAVPVPEGIRAAGQPVALVE